MNSENKKHVQDAVKELKRRNATKGTPTRMLEALRNGIRESSTVLMTEGEINNLSRDVLPHVFDYLAQQFGIDMMEAAHGPLAQVALKELFDRLKAKG